MNKDLEKKLIDKLFKYLEKYPIENWEDSLQTYGVFISPTCSIKLQRNNYSALIYLLGDHKTYECFTVDDERLYKVLDDELKRRRDSLELKSQKKEKEALDKFLASDF